MATLSIPRSIPSDAAHASSAAGALLDPQQVYRRRPRPENKESLEELPLNELRQKIRSNCLSFPSQVPTFEKHDRPDLQRKLVQLYFLLGWSCDSIAQRYGMLRQRVQQILTIWKRRAVQTGYIQEIPPPIVLRKLTRVQ
jgi:hypothetical protein